MNAVTIDAVMEIVEEDHRLVLDKTRALKDAVGCLMVPGDKGLREALHSAPAAQPVLRVAFRRPHRS